MKIMIRNHLIKSGVDGSVITEEMIDGLEIINGNIVSVQYHIPGYPDVVCLTNNLTVEELSK